MITEINIQVVNTIFISKIIIDMDWSCSSGSFNYYDVSSCMRDNNFMRYNNIVRVGTYVEMKKGK